MPHRQPGRGPEGDQHTSGICTVQMPEDLVVCYTLNNQSIDGAASVAASVRSQRGDIRMLPVPMRIESGEKDKLNLRREYAMDRFGGLFAGRDALERERSWDDVEVPYIPLYAYEEILAVFKDRPGASRTVLAAAERVAQRLTGDDDIRARQITEARRRWALASYAGTSLSTALDDDLEDASAPRPAASTCPIDETMPPHSRDCSLTVSPRRWAVIACSWTSTRSCREQTSPRRSRRLRDVRRSCSRLSARDGRRRLTKPETRGCATRTTGCVSSSPPHSPAHRCA